VDYNQSHVITSTKYFWMSMEKNVKTKINKKKSKNMKGKGRQHGPTNCWFPYYSWKNISKVGEQVT